MKKVTKYDFTYAENRFMGDFSDAIDEFCDTIECCDECPIKQYCAYSFNDDDGYTFGTAIVEVFNFFKEHEVEK